jgi:hypothetical protein
LIPKLYHHLDGLVLIFSPAFTLDSGAWTIQTIHWNICMGTISSFLPKRSDLLPLLQALKQFITGGKFLLTDLGHGLDVRNLETTATHQADGSFVQPRQCPQVLLTLVWRARLLSLPDSW